MTLRSSVYAVSLTYGLLSMAMHTMTFKSATDVLFDQVDHADLAKALGVSVASVRQARLNPDAKAHRAPPKDWPYAVIRLAEQQIMRNRQLIEAIRKEIAAS